MSKIKLSAGSPAYSFDGAQTTEFVGVPVPIIYGEHKTSGNIVNQFVYNNGQKSYLNSLLAICEGEIDSISDIKVNDIPIASLTGSSVVTKLGTNTQTVLSNWNDQHNLYTLNEIIANAGVYNYTTTDSDVEAFELNFLLENGLYVMDSLTYKYSQFVVQILVEYKLHSASTWTSSTQTHRNLSTTALRLKVRVEGLTSGQYDIRITKVTRTDNIAGYSSPIRTSTLTLETIDEIKTDDLAYPNTVLAGFKMLAVENVAGSTPTYTMTVKGKKVLIPDIQYSGSSVDWEDYYYDPATSQYKRLTDNAVCSWDGTTYISAWSANPVWCLKDLIISSRYGLGEFIDSSMIDTDSFVSMSQYCEEKVPDGAGGFEKRFRMDVVIDNQMEALDCISELMSCCRGNVYYSDGMIKLKINKPGSVVGFFGMGSIVKGSFRQSFKPISDVPNVVEVTFNDEDKDYSEETVEYVDEESIVAGDPVRRESIRLYLTRISQALREARYYQKKNKYTKRSIKFKAGINASQHECGDVIAVSHDVPQWGFSGRILTGSTTTAIKLDQTVTVESGLTYKLFVMFRDTDTIEEVTVTSTAGQYSEIEVNALSKAPSAYDEYAFGQSGINYKPFIITKLKETNENEFEIDAEEYNALVYDDSAVIIPDNNYTALSNVIPLVSEVSLYEDIAKAKDGTIENFIDVSFQCPFMDDYYLRKFTKAKIYLKEESGAWILRGSVDYPTGFFKIYGGLNELVNYTVAIVSVDHQGKETSIDESPQETILVIGKTAPPASVTGFDVSQEGSMLKFSWNANTEADLAKYIIKKGESWESGTIIAEEIDSTSFVYPVSEVGNTTFLIKAIDTSKNESAAPASDTINISTPPDMNFMNTIDLWSFNLTYKSSGLALYNRNDYDPDYDRPVFGLMSAESWEQWKASGGTWEADATNILNELDAGPFVSTGSFEMVDEYADLETIFQFKIISDPKYKNVTGGSFTLQVSYSLDGVTYTAFADVDPNITYKARYLKFKIILATSDTNYNIYLYSLSIFIYSPLVVMDWGKDIAIPVTGKTIYFASTFTNTPRITASITNGVLGILKISNKTTTSADFMVYDLSGSAIGTAEIDFDAKGM